MGLSISDFAEMTRNNVRTTAGSPENGKTSLKGRMFITPGKLPKDLYAALKRASYIPAHMRQEHLRGFAQAASLQYALAIIRQLTDTTGNICTKKGLVINQPVLFYPH